MSVTIGSWWHSFYPAPRLLSLIHWSLMRSCFGDEVLVGAIHAHHCLISFNFAVGWCLLPTFVIYAWLLCLAVWLNHSQLLLILFGQHRNVASWGWRWLLLLCVGASIKVRLWSCINVIDNAAVAVALALGGHWPGPGLIEHLITYFNFYIQEIKFYQKSSPGVLGFWGFGVCVSP